MRSARHPSVLLVEGKNDQHVIWALCQQKNVPENFSVMLPGKVGGISKLIKDIPIRLQTKGLQNLGIVVDADENPDARWKSIQHILKEFGYHQIPKSPLTKGTIIVQPPFPKVGVWIMPNNQIPGILEDFVAHLIPSNDQLISAANNVLQEIESKGINQYSLTHHAKARIHTWLAWQETPGQPMGQAITAKVLQYDQPIAQTFVGWLNRLFNNAG